MTCISIIYIIIVRSVLYYTKNATKRQKNISKIHHKIQLYFIKYLQNDDYFKKIIIKIVYLYIIPYI